MCVFARRDSINFMHTYAIRRYAVEVCIIEHIISIRVYMCRCCAVCLYVQNACACVLVGVGSGKRTLVLVPLE